jgi:hypothetical protein
MQTPPEHVDANLQILILDALFWIFH